MNKRQLELLEMVETARRGAAERLRYIEMAEIESDLTHHWVRYGDADRAGQAAFQCVRHFHRATRIQQGENRNV